ncbi:MAG: glycerophosphodiester phosphodiesterase family protein [Mucilaginibacter sp.]|nr:glycerophosphodiester phosphodiesterase family protein [Mucilaginibacter sp.]
MRRFLLVLTACIVWINANAQPNPAPKARHKFIVVCHRGDHVIYPENTLAAYAEAIKNRADYVEIDLRTTKDSALVSMHDGTVDRMTNAKGPVKDKTLAEIEQLQVKSRDSLDKTVYRVPTFEEILKLCKDKIYIYIDFKNAPASATYAMLKKYGMEKQVLVYINAIQQFIDWRHVAPDMPLMFSMPNSVKDVEGMKTFINQVKPDILDGGWKEYTKEMVQFANEQHIPIWPDIQSKDEDKNWDAAVALGLKGLQTDHPAALIKYLEEKGLR